jgi:hypothetical protein
MKALPGTIPKPDRKAHLREYILACVSENVLSWGDLFQPGVIGKLGKAIATDFEDVLKDLGKNGGANALRLAAFKFIAFAEGIGRT